MARMQFNWKKNWMKVVLPTGAVVITVIGIIVACVQPNNRKFNTTLNAADILTTEADSETSKYTASGSNYKFTGDVTAGFAYNELSTLKDGLGIKADTKKKEFNSVSRTVTGGELEGYLRWVEEGTWTDANNANQTLDLNDIAYDNVDKLKNTTIVINENTTSDDEDVVAWTNFTITLIGGDWYGGSSSWYIQFEFDNPNA